VVSVPGPSQRDDEEEGRRVLRRAHYLLLVLLIGAVLTIVLACYMGASLVYGQ
jgi:hypothetical protein